MRATRLRSDAVNRAGIAFWRFQLVRPTVTVAMLVSTQTMSVRLASRVYRCCGCGGGIAQGDYYACTTTTLDRLCLDCTEPVEAQPKSATPRRTP